MAILQHNWTGRLAVHASYTNQALVFPQPVKGVNSSKTHGKGAWLKAASHARLRIHASSDMQLCTLSLHVQDHVLLQRPLADAQLKLRVLPCQQQHTSILLLTPLQQNPAAAAALTYCFSFFDQPDCDSFTSALQAMLDRQRQQQQQQQQQQHRDALALHTTSGPAGQQQRDIAGQETITGASHAGTTGTTTPVPQGLQKAPSNQLEGQAEAKAAVKRLLLDAEFQRLVEQVEAVWDEVEAELCLEVEKECGAAA